LNQTITVLQHNTLNTHVLKQILSSALEQYNDKFSLISATLSNQSFDSGRNQHNAQKILCEIYEQKKSKNWENCIAITHEDIFVDGMTFVFGFASPTGGVCIVSLNRLVEHSTPTQREKERLVKEIAHEVGHIYGLQHCTKNCVMSFSNSISEIDSKDSELCTKCKRTINKPY